MAEEVCSRNTSWTVVCLLFSVLFIVCLFVCLFVFFVDYTTMGSRCYGRLTMAFVADHLSNRRH